MTSISSPGIGSGLDIRGLVDSLVRAEGQPAAERLDRREAKLQAQLSAMGSLKSALSGFKSTLLDTSSFNSFARRSASSGNEELFSATAGSRAQPASYQVEVERLASAHRLASEGISDSKQSIGTGTITFQYGDPTKPAQSVQIGSNDSSLEGIRDAINAANIDVSASIIRGDDGYQLVFGAKHSGEDNSLRISVAEDPLNGSNTDMEGLSRFAYDPDALIGEGKNLSEMVAAEDAITYIDGIKVTSATNTISDSIPGVSINLASAAPGMPTTLTVGVDKAAATEAVEKFVEGFNSLSNTFKSLGGYDSEAQQGGILQGDATLRGIESQIRKMTSEVVPGLDGAYRALTDLGIRTQADGTLSLDSARLSRALDENFDDVVRIFAASGKTTDSLVGYVGASRDTQPGNYNVDVNQLATRGSYNDPVVSVQSLVVDDSNDSFRIRVDGVHSGVITLNRMEYADGNALAAELQSKINGDEILAAAGVNLTVGFEGGGLTFTSNRYGSSSMVEISSVKNSTASALIGLSANTSASVAGQDVDGTIGGMPATGNGKVLTGTGSATGLRVDVQGGQTGARGQVTFSRGVSDQLNTLFDQYLGNNSFLTARSESLDTQIKSISDQRESLIRRLDSMEERYMRQFSALDSMMAEMSSMSNYLASQLSALPGAGGSRR